VSEPSVLLVEEGGVGGVADYTGELAGALARQGCRVQIATACDHAYPEQPGVTVHGVFPYVRGGSRIGRVVRSLRISRIVNGLTHMGANVAVLRLARRCDVVHVQGGEWPPLGLVQAALVRAFGRSLVWTPHNTFDRGEHAYARSRVLTARCASAIVLHADSDRAALPSDILGRCVVIAHGQYGDLGRHRRGAARGESDARPADDRELSVLLFGQLRADKGVRDLLEAAAAVDRIHVQLVGEDKGALADVADLLHSRELGARVVVREGFVAIDDVPAVFEHADVVALPYHQASASGVLMLAYGFGRPVVAYPVGGLPEYVLAGETGWLCERPDPDALAATLLEIRDAGRRVWRERGDAARRAAHERYSWDAIARRTIDLYRDVTTGRLAAMPTADRERAGT
jgi:glycosyltransferase involved in cell wall biosynthesis